MIGPPYQRFSENKREKEVIEVDLIKSKMRIEPESDAVSASRKHLVFAYYVTGHGFGHATRVTEVPFLLSLFSKFLSFSGITSIFGPMGCLITLFFSFERFDFGFWVSNFGFGRLGKKEEEKSVQFFFLCFCTVGAAFFFLKGSKISRCFCIVGVTFSFI